MSATTSRTLMTAARRRIVAAVNVLLACSFLYALSPDAASAQQAAALPQVRFVSSDPLMEINAIELCTGPAVAGCRAVLRSEGNWNLGPLLEGRGAQRLGINDTVNLGESATFLVYIQSHHPFAVTLEVAVHITGGGDAVSIVSPISGTIEASGAMAPLNGLRVLQGQLFSIVPDVPAVIDLDVRKLWDVASLNTPYPQTIPRVRIFVRRIG